MKTLKDFIVRIPKKYNEKWTSESGMEWYLSEFHNKRELANVAVEVVSAPLKLKTNIENGDKVLIDIISILDSEQFKYGNTGNNLCIDREQGLYRVNKDLVLLYQKKGEEQWRCFNDICVLEEIIEDVKPISEFIIIPGSDKKKADGKGTVIIPNDFLKSEGVKKGDVVYFDKRTNIEFYLEGKKYMWLKNRNILACLV